MNRMTDEEHLAVCVVTDEITALLNNIKAPSKVSIVAMKFFIWCSENPEAKPEEISEVVETFWAETLDNYSGKVHHA